MNRADFLQRLKELHANRYAHQWKIGDLILESEKSLGREQTFELVKQVTGNQRNFYTRCMSVAKLYSASLRFPTLAFTVYERLKAFPMSFLERFIPEVKDSGRSGAQILALAIEQFGSDPAPHRNRRPTKNVKITMQLYGELVVRARKMQQQPQTLVAEVLQRYLRASEIVKADSPSAVGAMGVVKAAEPVIPKASAATESRPTYAERRERKYTSKINIAFVECRGRSKEFLDTEHGAVRIPKNQRVDSFHSLEDALAAAKEYSEDRGYVVAPFMCAKCSNGNPVWHLRAASEVDLSKEQAEIRATVQDFIQNTRASLHQQHAQA